MRISFLIILYFLSLQGSGQTWKYKSGGNSFDGKYRTSYVKGTGGSFPYQKAQLVVNYFEKSGSLNVYIDDAGYAGCKDKVVYINFDDNDEVFSFSSFTNSSEDLWFLSKCEDLSKIELLNMLMFHSVVNVRLVSRCGVSDYKFSLTGSSKAIKYVASEWTVSELAREKEIKRKEIEEEDRIVKAEKEKERKRVEAEKDEERKRVEAKMEEERKILEVIPELLEKYDSTIYSFYFAKENCELFKSIASPTQNKKIEKGKVLVVDDSSRGGVYKVVFVEGYGETKEYRFLFKSDAKLIKF